MLLLAMISLAAGLFFKIAAVPFHMWAPDVYEGAPTSVTAFLSTGSKAASFVSLCRIFIEALRSMHVDWAPLLGLVAAITIMVGNWAAVTQENSKRLLGLLVDLKRRLSAARTRRRKRIRLHRTSRLSVGLHADEHGSVRCDHQFATSRDHWRQRRRSDWSWHRRRRVWQR